MNPDDQGRRVRFRRRRVVDYSWAIIFLSVIACFVPFYMYGSLWVEGYPVGAFEYLTAYTNATRLSSSSMYAITQDDQAYFQVNTKTTTVLGSLFMGMAIPNAIDIMIETYLYWLNRKNELDNVVRLNRVERFVFILGVFVYGAVYCFPSNMNIMSKSYLNWSFEPVNTILTTSPILIFLERNTTVFTSAWTLFLVSLSCVGGIIYNLEGIVSSDLPLHDTLDRCGKYLLVSQSSLIILTSVLCLYKNVKRSGSGVDMGTWLEGSEVVTKFYANQVIALHMISLTLVSVINIAWYCTSGNVNNTTGIFLVLSTTSVFVIEMRIRYDTAKENMQMLDSKRIFVRFIAHEIRTPLSSAVMGMELLGMGLTEHTGSKLVEFQENLALVHESIQVAESILDSLIEVDLRMHESDKNTHTMVLNTESIIIDKWLKDVSVPLQLHARRNQVNLRVLADKNTNLRVNLDHRRMAQALRSLIAYAIENTPYGGVVTVSLRQSTDVSFVNGRRESVFTYPSPMNKKKVHRSSSIRELLTLRKRVFLSSVGDLNAMRQYAVIDIAYGGKGFNTSDFDSVNKKLFMFAPHELQGSNQSGLGLFLAKTIVEKHRGQLLVGSEGLGKGNTFVLGIPLDVIPVDPLSTYTHTHAVFEREFEINPIPTIDLLLQEARRCSDTTTSTHPITVFQSVSDSHENVSDTVLTPVISKRPSSNMHVLVVEDSRVARTMLVKILNTMDCTTDEAEDGEQAVRKVTSGSTYNIILCDSVMPNMDGPTAVEIIRKWGYIRPILGVTGNVLPEQIEDFLHHGVNEVLSKPVKVQVLKDAIQRWTNNHPPPPHDDI
jgi:CheY-like chemotaxis protein